MVNIENIVARDGYLVDKSTGEKVIFYECDPQKNTECDQSLCRTALDEDDGDFGFCAKTPNPTFRKDGSRAFYAVLKENTYWGREYVD